MHTYHFLLQSTSPDLNSVGLPCDNLRRIKIYNYFSTSLPYEIYREQIKMRNLI